MTVKGTLTAVGPASRSEPAVAGHRMGLMSIGPVRRAWCSCGWRWRQEDPAMGLDDARRLEREWVASHLALARPPAPPDDDWCRERPG